jgi:cytochrome bd ubiquinol oxidase subunit II
MLETTWFILWGLLWAMYFMLDGFDLGLGSMLPVLSKSDRDRRVIYNAMGPFWDGNEVWLLTAGGATFAAFPRTYAVMFSSLYTPLMLLLFALILRGISFEFRSKVESPAWRTIWDACLTGGSFVAALLLGVAFANIFAGIPVDVDGVFHGNLFTLLNPYGLVGGVLFVLLFLHHGALWLSIKAEDALQARAARAAVIIWPVLVLVAVTFLVHSWFATSLYDNYLAHPVLFVIPALAVVGLVGARVFAAKRAWWKAWGASGLAIFACTFFGVAGLFPNLFPSSLDPAATLTAFNTASSPLTLKIMLGVALVAVPSAIAYQTMVYVWFRGKVTDEVLAEEEAY